MLRRCYDTEHVKYAIYGGRGIRVCRRWRHSFEHFLEDMGTPEAHLTLDRRDSNKGYTPSNCRWATRVQQARNMRSNHLMVLNGETRCLHEWSVVLGIPVQTIYSRLKVGWTAQQALAPGRFGGVGRSQHVKINGREQTIAAWAREYGLEPQTVYKRLKKGEAIESALQRPTQQEKSHAART